jgi:hypothetical protein
MKKGRARGRPHKPGPRYPSGRLIRSGRDRGTPELLDKRRQLFGDPDDRRASSLLGVLAARGLIEPDEYEAAEQYAELPGSSFSLRNPERRKVKLPSNDLFQAQSSAICEFASPLIEPACQ